MALATNDLDRKISALEADIKEIYLMLAQPKTETKSDKDFDKLSIEEKVLQAHRELLMIAKQAGVTLPK